jgi:phosphonate transport system ATP-binding protein
MIEVEGLRVVLPPATVALYGVDLAIGAGERVMIIGRSGAGKSTFLRSINRLVEPTAGTIRLAGRPVTGAGPVELRQARRQIGMIFQQFNLVRRVSVLANVLAGRLGYVPPLPSLLGRFPAADRALALECLAQVGLADVADRRADTLSGASSSGWPSPGR